MKAYKGFNKNMTCRGFQYEEGKTYETDKADLCKAGFHACEDPIDCFRYYKPNNSEYHEVEMDDVSDQTANDDTKRVSKKITIGAKLSIAKIVNASISYRLNKCVPYKSQHITGNYGAASATGNYGVASATGNYGAASATGSCGAASATGYKGAASATGNYGAASADGLYSSALSAGRNGKVKGKLGTAIFCVERGEYDGEGYPIISALAAIVDGETIKEDVWYTVKDGKWVEAE